MSNPAHLPPAGAAQDAKAARAAALAEAQRDPWLRWLLPLGALLGAAATWLGTLLGNTVGGL